MRHGRVILAATLGVCLAAPALAQQQAQNTVLEAHRVAPKPGMRAQLEAGRIKHMAWHKQQGDKFTWHVWEIVTGPETGGYIIVSPGHQWKDFDGWNQKMAKGDAADAEINLAPYQVSSTMSYWVHQAELSRDPAPGTPMPAFGTLTTYRLKSGKADQFREAVRTIRGALDKGNWPLRGAWYSLASGGPVGSWAVFTGRASIADMALPQPSMRQVVETALGKEAAEKVFQSFSDCVEDGTSELLQFRQDLSYLPSPTS